MSDASSDEAIACEHLSIRVSGVAPSRHSRISPVARAQLRLCGPPSVGILPHDVAAYRVDLHSSPPLFLRQLSRTIIRANESVQLNPPWQ